MTHDPPRVRLKPIALPPEHGSWGFLFEPILIGLIVAPSAAGLALALAVISAFLLRNPVRIVLRARRRTPDSPRLSVARRVAAAYAVVAGLCGAGAIAVAGIAAVWPLLAASPLGIAYMLYDSQNRGRTLGAEFLGPVVLGASAPSIALCAGWQTPAALALWGVVVAKAVPTVVYVRARLSLEDGNPAMIVPTLFAHAVAVAATAVMARHGDAPWIVPLALVALSARAAIGLSPARVFHTPKQIGISEFVYSGLYVAATAVGYYAAM